MENVFNSRFSCATVWRQNSQKSLITVHAVLPMTSEGGGKESERGVRTKIL